MELERVDIQITSPSIAAGGKAMRVDGERGGECGGFTRYLEAEMEVVKRFSKGVCIIDFRLGFEISFWSQMGDRSFSEKRLTIKRVIYQRIYGINSVVQKRLK